MRTFVNPIIPGFHPDPSVCRVGRDIYLVTSSFEYFPGVPIFHSRDLVNWKQIGHVLTRKSQLDLHRVRSSGGIYAPTIRHANGRFYMITTNVDGGGNFFVTAQRPEGPWSDPIWLDRDGIDPSLLFADGTAYYTRNGKGPDRDHPLIYQTRIDPRSGRLASGPRQIWFGLGGIWPEAPHLYKIGRWYYLMTAEGGTAYDHSIVIARSRSAFGPFEGCPDNPILTHRHLPKHPIGATGHADLFQASDGSWWVVLLGVRPHVGRAGRAGRTGHAGRDGRDGRAVLHHHLGRETFLAPVTWTKGGWPVIGSSGRVELTMAAPKLKPASVAPLPVRDDFDSPSLSLVWNFLRNPRARDWSLTKRPGHLRLVGSTVTLDDVDSPALVARRQQHFDVRCHTLLEFSPRRVNQEAGLTIRANENFHYDLAVRKTGSGARSRRQVLLRARTRGLTKVMTRLPIPADGPIHLQVTATRRWYAFSACVGLGTVVPMRRLGKLSTEALSSESIWASGTSYFTGVFFALYATGNRVRSTVPADFDWFDYVPKIISTPGRQHRSPPTKFAGRRSRRR